MYMKYSEFNYFDGTNAVAKIKLIRYRIAQRTCEAKGGKKFWMMFFDCCKDPALPGYDRYFS